MQFGVSAYSFPFGCGFAQRGAAHALMPMDAFALAELAATWQLVSIETPLRRMLPDLTPATIYRVRETLEEAGLGLVVDAPVIDVDEMATILPLARQAGAHTVRSMVSPILEGLRVDIPGGWAAHLAEMRRRIAAIRPLLDEYDLVLALENHQDTTSDELIALCEAGGPRVGITLDVANPLAVAEEPLAFARKVGPWIRNVHIKDYQVFATPSGYRLVRCALGEGVVPFAELLRLLEQVAPRAVMHIELAALYARHIRLFEDRWWESFPSRDIRDVLPALRALARDARPETEPWQTPWERDAEPDEVAAYEHDQFERSVRYLRTQGVGVELST